MAIYIVTSYFLHVPKGFYQVPNYPDWGWRTDIVFSDEDSFKIVMYNVSPEGEEDLAVEAIYKRK